MPIIVSRSLNDLEEIAELLCSVFSYLTSTNVSYKDIEGIVWRALELKPFPCRAKTNLKASHLHIYFCAKQ